MFMLLENRLYGSSRPSRAELDRLLDAGIELVISLTERPLDDGLQRSLHAAEIDYVHEPITDFTIPSVEQMRRVYRAYRKCARRGGAVLVHCAAGMGRTGTVLACILAAERKLSAGAAIKRVRSVRPGALETHEQQQFVADWLASLHRRHPGD